MAKKDDVEDSQPQKGAPKGILIALIIIVLLAIPVVYFLNTSGDDDDECTDPEINILLIGTTGQEDLTFEEIQDMETVSGESSYQNKFGNWKGLGTY